MAAQKSEKEWPAFGEATIRCGKRACKWRGNERELKRIPHRKFANCEQLVCPLCGCDNYYIETTTNERIN